MNSIKMGNFLVTPLVLSATLACSSAQTSSSGAGAQTTAASEAGWHLRPFEEVKLENGLRILFIEDRSLPRVGFNLMVMTGSAHDPDSKPGLNYITAALLEKGTTKRSASQYADAMGQIASELNISPGVDYTNVGASSLSTEKQQCLDLMAEAVLSPAFAEEELRRERTKLEAEIAHIVDNPSKFTDLKMDLIAFGNHPYSHPSFGTLESMKTMSQSEVVKHYFKFYRPNNALLAVTGDIDNSFKDKVKKTFSAWQAKEIQPAIFPLMNEVPAKEIHLFSKPDLAQAQIRLVSRGIKRTDPDYLKLKIANAILGGDFVSRLNMKVRDDLGLTYSIHSAFDPRLDFGLFEISTFTRNEKIGETIVQTKAVLQQFVDDGVKKSEVEAVKNVMAGQFPGSIETTDKLAYSLQILRRYGIPDDYLQSFRDNLQKITAKDVNEAIRRHIRPEYMKTVVYADKEKVQDQLAKIGTVVLQ
jgi:zinc protease